MNERPSYYISPVTQLTRTKTPLLHAVLQSQQVKQQKPPEVPQGAKSLAKYRRTCGAAQCLTCPNPVSQNKKYCFACAQRLGIEENKVGEIDVLNRMVAQQTGKR